MKPKTYTTKEAAKLEGISERGIRKRIENKDYPNAFRYVKKIIYGWKIPAEDLAAHAKSKNN